MGLEGLHRSRTGVRPGYGHVACEHRAEPREDRRHEAAFPREVARFAALDATLATRLHGPGPSIQSAGADWRTVGSR